MKKLFKLLVVSITFLTTPAYSDDIPEDNKLKGYKITSDILSGKVKRSVEVLLPSRIDEEALRSIADEIIGLSTVDVQRTFIGYRTEDSSESTTYWATTHYNPELNVKIVGASQSAYEKIKNAEQPDDEKLGSWMSSRGFDSKLIAYKKNGEVYIKSVYKDGSYSNEIYEKSVTEKGIKLQSESGKEFGEFFLINKKGELEFWSENGNYYTAKKS